MVYVFACVYERLYGCPSHIASSYVLCFYAFLHSFLLRSITNFDFDVCSSLIVYFKCHGA